MIIYKNFIKNFLKSESFNIINLSVFRYIQFITLFIFDFEIV